MCAQYVLWVVAVWGGLELLSLLIDTAPLFFKLKQIRVRRVLPVVDLGASCPLLTISPRMCRTLHILYNLLTPCRMKFFTYLVLLFTDGYMPSA
jgi:hypothetical protein